MWSDFFIALQKWCTQQYWYEVVKLCGVHSNSLSKAVCKSSNVMTNPIPYFTHNEHKQWKLLVLINYMFSQCDFTV